VFVYVFVSFESVFIEFYILLIFYCFLGLMFMHG